MGTATQLPHRRLLRRDPILWIALAGCIAIVAPFLIAEVPRQTLANWTELYADVLALSLVILSFGWTRRDEDRRSADLFRHIIVGAFGVLFASNIVAWIQPNESAGQLTISQTYIYLFYYFLLFTAFAVQPHRESAQRSRIWLRFIRPLGTTLLLFGLLTYLIGIPSTLKAEAGHGGVPSISLYVVLDGILVAVGFHTWRTTSRRRWRAIYGWLLLAFVLSAAADLVDAGMRFGLIPYVESGDALDLLWFAQYPAFVVAGRLLVLSNPRELPEPTDPIGADTALLRAFGSWRWLAYALSLPILHLCLQSFGVLDPTLQSAREAFVLVFILSMGGAAVAHERLLYSANRQLERDHAETQEQLQFARRLEGIGQLTAGIAHDFNNKLTVINGASELLLDELPPGDSRRELAQDILETGERAAVVVSQLLAFSRRQIRHPRVLDLDREIRHLMELFERTVGAHIEVVLDLSGERPAIEIDPNQLEQILLNLVMNARDAMPGGGRLTVSTALAPDPSQARLTVQDTGVGMPDDVRSRAVEPFFTTKPTGQGTGLGLATVFGLVKQNGGRVVVESEAGAGTAIAIHLPTCTKSIDLEPITAPESPGRRARLDRVLLVEDESSVRALVRGILERSGYSIVEAANGAEAIRTLHEIGEGIDILITDVVMPGMTGAELAAECVRLHPHILTLFISGYERDRAETNEAGKTDAAFLQKPFSRARLLGALDALRRGRSDS